MKNLLVLTAVPVSGTNRVIGDWSYARFLGYNVTLWPERPRVRPDAVVCMSISRMAEAYEARRQWPDVPLWCYQWDAYEWVWSNPRPGEYDYGRWGELLRQSREIWVPSVCTGQRTREWWGLDNWRVVLSSVPWWDPPGPVTDEGYLLCSLREIPDPWCNRFEQACEELGIPYRRSNHTLSWEEYQRTVAGCRALVSHYYELSTGGLTLLEGYRLGKPVLLNASPWHGGIDYFGNRAQYFREGDYADFKHCLQELWTNPPAVPADAREWVEDRYDDGRFIRTMLERIHATL